MMNYEISHPEMLSNAFDFYGLTEIKGIENNPIIMSFFSEIGHDYVKDDETSWCSAFINYLAFKNGYERSGKLNARSWLNVGEPTSNPTVGDVVVFWRESKESWKGHVGLFIRDNNEFIWTLGGNQSNQVRISPYRKSQVLGYRMLKKIT